MTRSRRTDRGGVLVDWYVLLLVPSGARHPFSQAPRARKFLVQMQMVSSSQSMMTK